MGPWLKNKKTKPKQKKNPKKSKTKKNCSANRIFAEIAKVIRDYFVFASPRSVFGPETGAILLTNQTQKEDQTWFGHPRFPALLLVCPFLLWVFLG